MYELEELFKMVAGYIALGIEIVATLVVAFGAITALLSLFRREDDRRHPYYHKKDTFVRLGAWLMLGLEFELAADIVRSAISPSWTQIGQLAAIAVIRTFLNFFLGKDVEKATEREATGEAKLREANSVQSEAMPHIGA